MEVKNKKTTKLLSSDYPELLTRVVDHAILYNLVPDARGLLDALEQAVRNQIQDLKKQPRLLKLYQNKIVSLKFIVLSSLENNEIINLIKNNLGLQFSLPGYSLSTAINHKLTGLLTIEEKNKLKEDLKKALLENHEKIIVNHEIKTVQDWLKNYISKVGLETDSSLVKAQYLTSLQNNKNIDPKEYNKLTNLFELYTTLNIPSDVPQGFEEEFPIIMDGKLYIFRRGVLEDVPELKGEYKEAKRLLVSPEQSNKDVEQVFAPREVGSQIKLAELEKALNNYSPDSLEYRVINQEINRLKKKK